MNRIEFPAMGTRVEAWSIDADDGMRLRAWFEQVEKACSRFRPESELSLLNRQAGLATSVSDVMWGAIRGAERARHLTDGLVDAGVGSAVKAWGYDRTFAEVVDLEDTPSVPSSRVWHLDGRVLHRSQGLTLDLGGIAKGWACDRAVEDGLAVVVSAGGDMRSGDPETMASITAPDGEVVVKLHVGVGALATSSTGSRRWRVAGAEVSHVIDPRTMRPVETPITSATILARTAVDAEAGAKAVLLLGESGLNWAADQPWIDAALVVWHDGSVFGTPGIEVAA